MRTDRNINENDDGRRGACGADKGLCRPGGWLREDEQSGHLEWQRVSNVGGDGIIEAS